MNKLKNELAAVKGLKTRSLNSLGIIVLSLVLIMGLTANAAVQSTPKKIDERAIMQKALKLQLPFIANQGQVEKEVSFYARTFGGTIYVTKKGEMVYSFTQVDPKEKATDKDSMPETIKSLALKETLVGASVTSPQGSDRSKTKVNYFIGNDKAKWKTNISTYNSVSLGEVYKGIDLSLKAYGKIVEKVFTVQPGADPSNIKLKMEGGKSLKVNEQGELEVETGLGVARFSKPVAYQEKNGKQEKVDVAYRLENDTYGFKTSAYDKSLPLIIDPMLLYGTYLGGTWSERGYGIAVDGSGNAYVTGETISTDFPTQNPYQPALAGPSTDRDIFVAQFSAAGNSLNYSTYLGGTRYDEANGIAVDGSGNAYVTGRTSSTDFPTLNPYQPALAVLPVIGGTDAFVAQLSAAGSLNYSTYLGGTAHDEATGIAVDGSGNAYVTGFTASTDFPIKNAYQYLFKGGADAFVAQLSAAGNSLNYSTYLGGSGNDQAFGIAVDGLGNAYVTGFTASTDFPTENPFQSSLGGGVMYLW